MLHLISPAWESHYPSSICTSKSKIISDHIPICLDTIPPGWGPFPFKFYRSWLYSEGFDNLVWDRWNSFSSNANPIANISYKIKATKIAIKSWLLIHRDNYKSKLVKIENMAQRLDAQAELAPLSPFEWQ